MPPGKKAEKEVPTRTEPPPGPGPKPAPAQIAKALKGRPSRKVSREMLILETRRLRAVFSEVAERYVGEVEARIASVSSIIETQKLSPGKIDAMLATVRELAVKPQKGRRKDLARIEKVAEKLFAALEE